MSRFILCGAIEVDYITNSPLVAIVVGGEGPGVSEILHDIELQLEIRFPIFVVDKHGFLNFCVERGVRAAKGRMIVDCIRRTEPERRD